MQDFLVYLFWPNPGDADYSSPKAIVLLVVCIACIVTSVLLSRWRKAQKNPVTRKLSKSWSPASMWFGIIGLVLVVSRVESISYVSMRVWWVLWSIVAIIYVGFQVRSFRSRHYEVLPQVKEEVGIKEQYLPKKKKRK